MSSTLDRATDERLVRLAMAQASKAIDRGDAPFGAVLADADGRVLARASNRQVSRHDPTAHAEITLLRVAARRLGRLTFEGHRVVTNAEPCSMCLSAMVKVRVAAIAFGAPHEPHMDPPIAAEEIVARADHRIELRGGILAAECAAQIAAARDVSAAVD